jgi:hypothetical protein
MTTALILLLVAAAALAGVAAVAHAVKNDGYGGFTARRTPPRSHVPDLFDPTRTA